METDPTTGEEDDKKQESTAWRSWMRPLPPKDEDWERHDGHAGIVRNFAYRNRADYSEEVRGVKPKQETKKCIEFQTFTMAVEKKKREMGEAKAKAMLEGAAKPPAPPEVVDARFDNCKAYDEQLITALDTVKEINVPVDGLLDNEKVVLQLQALEFKGLHGSDKVGRGSLTLSKMDSGKHRLHFAMQSETATFKVKEYANRQENKSGMLKEEDQTALSVMHQGSLKENLKAKEIKASQTISNDYRVTRELDGYYSVMHVEDELYHVHTDLDDIAQLGAHFDAGKKAGAIKDCCAVCCAIDYLLCCKACCFYYQCKCFICDASCCSCCTACCKACTDACTNYFFNGFSTWTGSTEYKSTNIDRDTKTFTEIKTTKESRVEAIEVPRMESMEGKEKVALLTEVSHKLTLVGRSSTKNKVAAVQVLVAKEEPFAKLIKMTSHLQSLAAAPPNQQNYKAMVMPLGATGSGADAPSPLEMLRGGLFGGGDKKMAPGGKGGPGKADGQEAV